MSDGDPIPAIGADCTSEKRPLDPGDGEHVCDAAHKVEAPKKVKPTIGITMGDPAGIGAEVIVKALADREVRSLGRFIIYGLGEALQLAADAAEIDPFWFRERHEDVTAIRSGVCLADHDECAAPIDARCPTAEAGRGSMSFIDDAVNACRNGWIDAIVTGPINKTSWRMAGYKWPGHTELLGRRFDAKNVSMMFAGGPFRVALVSTHVPLFELRNRFTIGRVFHPIELLDHALRRFWQIDEPRIAVAALNPHAGEHGAFGDEEDRIIKPAILMARDLGIDARGPFAADTLFHKASTGCYDGIIAMYHDQALIPVKLVAFESAVNVTLGLSIIRTSVDHGTAFDIAGKNRANPESMKAAIRLACEMATNHRVVPPRKRQSLESTEPAVTRLD